MEREPIADPIAAKAALEGAKIVMSLRASTVWWLVGSCMGYGMGVGWV